MLGISVYPEKNSEKEIIDYIELAAKYNFKRVFTTLLSINENINIIKSKYKKIISHARKHGMEVIIDISPTIFDKLNISYNDLSFFYDLGVTGIRLDEGFDGLKESLMSYNDFNLDIEINMSSGTKYIDNILSFNPNRKKIIACHNFYPMKYSGLSLNHFIKTSIQYKKLGIRSAAFVSSQNATNGPWNIMDSGLCTLEMHRNLPISTQVKHLLMLDLVDDIIIANSFASEEELKEISSIKLPTFDIEFLTKPSNEEKEIILNEEHFNRGDCSDYLIRSTQSRLKFHQNHFIPNNTNKNLEKGQIIICNDKFMHYKGELQLIKLQHEDIDKRKNIIAKIVDHELFLIDYLKPWTKFKFKVFKN